MRVEPMKLFERQVKRLTKKYPSLAEEIPAAILPLINNRLDGFVAMKKNLYKIRVPIASKSVGKRGGTRIIAHVRIVEDIAYLVSIYDKAEYSDVADDVLKAFFNDYPE